MIGSKIANTRFITNLLEVAHGSIKKHLNTISLVSCLFCVGCPSAVLGFVVPVNVNAVYGMGITRRESHIGMKIGEAHKPSVTNLDSPPAITVPVGIPGVSASLNHILPTFMESSSGETVRSIGFCCNLWLHTSARDRFSSLHASAEDDFFSSAVTDSLPERLSVFPCVGMSYYLKISEFKASEVLKSWVDVVVSFYHTPARLCKSVSERLSANYFLLSAIAKASPSRDSIVVSNPVQNRKITEFLTGEVDEFWHSEGSVVNACTMSSIIA